MQRDRTSQTSRHTRDYCGIIIVSNLREATNLYNKYRISLSRRRGVNLFRDHLTLGVYLRAASVGGRRQFTKSLIVGGCG
jgi:hypothetical protein